MYYRVTIHASKEGSIGTKYCERRQYTIETDNPDDINRLTIREAYNEGLEHVLVTTVKPLP